MQVALRKTGGKCATLFVAVPVESGSLFLDVFVDFDPDEVEAGEPRAYVAFVGTIGQKRFNITTTSTSAGTRRSCGAGPADASRRFAIPVRCPWRIRKFSQNGSARAVRPRRRRAARDRSRSIWTVPVS